MHPTFVSSNHVLPTKSYSYSNYSRQAYDFSEVTLALNLSHESADSGRLTEPMQHLLAEILVKAGIISHCDVLNARHVGRSEEAKKSFAEIVDMFSERVLTLEQAIVAINHIHLTDAPLCEALSLVCKRQPSRVVCESVIDFLKQTGLVTDNAIEGLKLEKAVEPKVLCRALLSASVIDSETLRNATRLRYLLNKGELDVEQAKEAMRFCISHNIDVEQCVDVCHLPVGTG
jgi:hypothetical protein